MPGLGLLQRGIFSGVEPQGRSRLEQTSLPGFSRTEPLPSQTQGYSCRRKWVLTHVLTLTPSGPGFACCGVCHCVRWTELSLETPSFRKVQSLTPIFPFSQRCHQEGEVLWLAVAVPTPETGSYPRRKRVEKGHSPVPTSGPCLRHPFHNQGSFCWASREQPGLGSRDTGRDPLQARPQPT